MANVFTGIHDVGLSDQGRREARNAGRLLARRGIRFGLAFTSMLIRAHQTLELMQEELGQPDLPVIKTATINERDYGALTGLNKDDARERWGDKQVQIWRRSYDVAPPDGESLRDTGARVWPYYIHNILPSVMRGERVLISAHGNSLRSMIMALEGLTPEEIVHRELITGVPILYRLAADTSVLESEVLEEVESSITA